MNPLARAALDDIVEMAAQLELWSENLTLAEYKSNFRTRLAMERALEIMSEASRRLPQAWKDLRPDLPWARIARLGNVLRHVYQAVDHETIYGIVIYDAPVFGQAAADIARQVDEGGG